MAVYQFPSYLVDEGVSGGNIEICIAIISHVNTLLTGTSSIDVGFPGLLTDTAGSYNIYRVLILCFKAYPFVP